MPGRGPSVLPGAESCGPTGLRMGLAAMLPGPAPTPDQKQEEGFGTWQPQRVEQVITPRRLALHFFHVCPAPG